MREYRYNVIMEKDGQRILWTGRAKNKAAFLQTKAISELLSEGWKIADAYKRPPEARRQRSYASMAFVDMGQAARF